MSWRLAVISSKMGNNKVSITSVDFQNFKAFESFSLRISNLSILVGPNNSGKSTILSAFRVLVAGLRRARSKTPELLDGPNGRMFGYPVNHESLPISFENVHTDYADTDTAVTFKLSNNNKLILFFPKDGGCNLIPISERCRVSSPKMFKQEFPVTVGVVPVLGPVEHRESILTEDTVRQDLSTHRASRHFRNYWLHNPEGFDKFSSLVAKTWPGMDIQFPRRVDQLNRELVMFCGEDRIPRELYWCGFGFQVWCQLLTHISRSRSDSIIIIDEPEIYLHPDVQRQLLGILRDTGPSVLLATHSTEIMGEADPSGILLVDKRKKSAERLRDIKGVQSALELVGSIQNITLTQLARNKRVLFVEDLDDYAILKRFAKRLDLLELSSGNGLTPIKSDGFSSWERIQALTWGIDKIGGELFIGAVFDRDYRSNEEAAEILEKLRKHLEFAYLLNWKEIENYLLVPSVLGRAIKKALDERIALPSNTSNDAESISTILGRITNTFRAATQAQYIARRNQFLAHSGRDQATITAETIGFFEDKWETLETRIGIVPGKLVLKKLRSELHLKHNINLTDARIIEAYKREEIPNDFKVMLQDLETFRRRS